MKLSQINNIKFQTQSYNNKKNNNLANNQKINNNNVNFCGLTNMLSSFWLWVENGGRAISFTVEDMGGTNIPRTIMGMFAGFRYTHKINFNSLKQEGIREFLTGPTMTFMPMAILAGLKKVWGKSANTHVENLRNLSYLAQGTLENGKIDDKKFISKISKDMLEKTIGKLCTNSPSDVCDLTKDDVENLSNAILKYKNILADNSINKKVKKSELSKALENAQEIFSSVVKRTKDNYKSCDFLTASYSVSNTASGATSFKDYVGYIGDYLNDFSIYTKKQLHNLDSNALISKFKNNYIGKRLTTVALMVTITGILMSYIPKLYTWASGGVNPNAKAIYNEADKKKTEGGAG